MLDDNWETINGAVAHQIEILNATNQINLIEAFVLFLSSHRGPSLDCAHPMPDSGVLMELHRTGTVILLETAGSYRNIEVYVGNGDQIIHTPPNWQAVPARMSRFFRDLVSLWISGDALDVAAFALWGVNWIHPFRNGNGRTARAFSYLCLCVKIGTLLPGRRTIINQIMDDRENYQKFLKIADDSYKSNGVPDLSGLKVWLHELLVNQISSVDGVL